MRNTVKREEVVWSGGVTHHTSIVFFLLLPTGNLEVQSSRTGKRGGREMRGRMGGLELREGGKTTRILH